MTHSAPAATRSRDDVSTADLVKLASTQLSALIRDEMALAKAEMAVKARNVGLGAGMLGAAGMFSAYGMGAALVCIGLALALVMPGWLAALIVAVALFMLAGLLALVGRSRVKRASPPMPADTISNVRADVAEVSEALHRARSNGAGEYGGDGAGLARLDAEGRP